MTAETSTVRARPWPAITVAVMILGYSGYYLCRSDLSVSTPLILEQYGPKINKDFMGGIVGLATALYALGKFIFGSTADIVGGRRMFLLGMAGAVLFTLLFGFGGPPLFMLAWCGNRFIQASGWVGMIKVTSRWFRHSVYGSVMGLISLSFLFGDFASRMFLSELITLKFTWQQIFYVSAAILAVIFLITLAFLRETPAERGLPAPEENPYALVTDDGTKRSVLELMKPLFRSPTFWAVCALSFGFTFMRETFNDWTPTYLHEALKMPKDDAGRASSLFPLFGGFSVLAVGFLSDRMGRGGRALILAGGLALGTVGLLAISQGHLGVSASVTAVAATGFVLIGPYSLLAGAISLGFGGRQASATAAGWIDGIGYIGGILSGKLIGHVADEYGWAPAFNILAITSAVSCAIAMVYWSRERHMAS